MKKTVFKYIVSVFLSLLIVFVQMGFVHTTHICGGTPVLSALGIGQSDLSCGGKVLKNSPESSCENKNHSLSKKPCCQNTSFSLQLDDKFQKQSFLDFEFVSVSAEFKFDILLENSSVKTEYVTDYGFIQTKDIPIWNQSFLI